MQTRQTSNAAGSRRDRPFESAAPCSHTDAARFGSVRHDLGRTVAFQISIGGFVIRQFVWTFAGIVIAFAIAGTTRSPANAQETSPALVVGPDGQPMPAQPTTGPQGRRGKPPTGDNGQSSPESDNANPGGNPGAKPGAKPDDDKPPTVIRRETIPAATGDPDELNAGLDDDGRVRFQFRDQGWVDLIDWLSNIQGQPIDWQELPADSVNIVSPESLDVAQTADLFNRHLLARGYTMLQLDGGLTVVKVDQINPGMVRRVDTDELTTTADHTVVRVMLDAGWLSAEKLATELKPMLSGAGKLTALATTNRLEAMDAAVNLRQIASLLAEERDAASRDALAPEFRLLHIPAEEAKSLLEEFLGVKKEPAGPMSREQMQQMQQMQRMRQQNGEEAPPPAKSNDDVSIVANVRQNSVLVRAPIDRVAIAAEFIKRIDVPGGSLRSLTEASSRVDVFRLVSLDPDKLIQIVSEMNVLEPRTRIQTDKENQAVIVSGSAADRFIVQSLIERLDGGKRRFEVLQLRRLSANEVAESIAFLMGQKDEDEDQGNSRRYFYGYGMGGDDDKKDKDEFRVAANARGRQVLLWANENEMEEVRALLIKLGELPPPGGSGQTYRVIEASATPETLEYLQRLKRQWEAMSGSELVLPDEAMFRDPVDEAQKDSEKEQGDTPETISSESPEMLPPEPAAKTTDVTTRVNPATSMADRQTGFRESFVAAVDDETANDAPANDKSSNASAATPTRPPETRSTSSAKPIEIALDSGGNLILRSDDTRALDRLENLMLQLSPPRRPYHIFRVRYASVSFIALDLQEYFEDADKKDDKSDRFYRWFFDEDEPSDDSPSGLAAAGKLKFVPNSDTGTLVVTGATGEQLRTIEELIRLWDVPEPINPRRSRFTKLVTIQYGRADKIAETVKDAYRDLLSSNDKAFQAQGGKGGRGGGDASNRAGGSGLEDTESGTDGGGQDFAFNGKLSLGVDEIGNTLLVSAEGEPLLELIVSMIGKLDEAAQPGGEIEIMRMSGDLSIESLRQAIGSLGGAKTEAVPAQTESRERSRRRSQ